MQDPQHTDGDAHAATVDADVELTDDDPLRSEVEQ
jgi:hypothetical protein